MINKKFHDKCHNYECLTTKPQEILAFLQAFESSKMRKASYNFINHFNYNSFFTLR